MNKYRTSVFIPNKYSNIFEYLFEYITINSNIFNLILNLYKLLKQSLSNINDSLILYLIIAYFLLVSLLTIKIIYYLSI